MCQPNRQKKKTEAEVEADDVKGDLNDNNDDAHNYDPVLQNFLRNDTRKKRKQKKKNRKRSHFQRKSRKEFLSIKVF